MKIAFFVLGFSLVYIATLFGAFSLALTEDGKKGDPFIFSHQKKQTFSLNPFVCLENGGKGNENTKKKKSFDEDCGVLCVEIFSTMATRPG